MIPQFYIITPNTPWGNKKTKDQELRERQDQEELFAKLMYEQTWKEQQLTSTFMSPVGTMFQQQAPGSLTLGEYVVNFQNTNTDDITPFPQSVWAAEGSGSTFSNGITILFPALQNSTSSIFNIDFSTTGTGTVKFKHFSRLDTSPNYLTYITQSLPQNISNIGEGTQQFTLERPWNIRLGDWVGFYVSSGATSLVRAPSTVRSPWIKYSVTDATSDLNNPIRAGAGCFSVKSDKAPFITILGDSITTGYPDYYTLYGDQLNNNLGPWPEFSGSFELSHNLKQYIPELICQNYANPNKQLTFIINSGSVAINRNSKVILIHCGVNDVGNGQTWTGSIKSRFDSIRSMIPLSKILLVDEILPANTLSDAASIEARNVNFQLITWCDNNNAYLVTCHDEFGVIRGSTGALDNLNPVYNKDGVHLTIAGQNLLAAKIYNKLKEILE